MSTTITHRTARVRTTGKHSSTAFIPMVHESAKEFAAFTSDGAVPRRGRRHLDMP